MDELNKRVLSIMEAKQLTRSGFSAALEVSLPVLTHISSGRNKPGLELIQKLLTTFPDLDPDWLLLGKGQMFRKTQEMPDLSTDLEQIKQLLTHLLKLQENEAKVLQYHQILRKEISYLQDLDQLLIQNQSYLTKLPLEFEEIQKSIKSKLLNKV
jgi:transcriptional regulator with XRE-family HTH domain